jgi:hypothetical protein
MCLRRRYRVSGLVAAGKIGPGLAASAQAHVSLFIFYLLFLFCLLFKFLVEFSNSNLSWDFHLKFQHYAIIYFNLFFIPLFILFNQTVLINMELNKQEFHI